MTFEKYLRETLNAGFNSDIGTLKVLIVLAMAAAIGLYVYAVYRLKCRSSFYSREFNNVLALLPVVTAGIVLAMQSSIVISLGMVGALSIVRFRNAVKSANDLLFLFWSISEGIVIGAGVFEIALVLAFAVTALMFLLDFLPLRRAPHVLVISADGAAAEKEIMEAVKAHAHGVRVKSREVGAGRLHMVVELSAKDESALMGALAANAHIANANLLSHDGERRY